MPDFSGLRTAAEEAARQPSFADIERRAARRVRRHQVAAGAGTAAVVAVAAVVASSAFGGAPGALLGATTPSATTPSATASEARGLPRAMWVTAGDSTNLYAVIRDICGTSETCRTFLRASSDGGRTWRSHDLPATSSELLWFDMTATGPRTLYAWSNTKTLSDVTNPRARPAQVSVDGGATWRETTSVATPVAAVPAGGALILDWHNNTVQVLDPAAARVAPLANQPPIAVKTVAEVPATAGLWVGGWDRTSGKPALAVSRDTGRTWTTTVFTTSPPVPSGPEGLRGAAYVPWVMTRDGTTVYADFAVDDGSPTRAYRLIPGATEWQLTQVQRTGGYGAHVTADGAYVVANQVDDHFEYQVSRDGGPLQPVTLAGLPHGPIAPTAAPDGSYYTHVDDAVYVSTDGWTYRKAGSP